MEDLFDFEVSDWSVYICSRKGLGSMTDGVRSAGEVSSGYGA